MSSHCEAQCRTLCQGDVIVGTRNLHCCFQCTCVVGRGPQANGDIASAMFHISRGFTFAIPRCDVPRSRRQVQGLGSAAPGLCWLCRNTRICSMLSSTLMQLKDWTFDSSLPENQKPQWDSEEKRTSQGRTSVYSQTINELSVLLRFSTRQPGARVWGESVPLTVLRSMYFDKSYSSCYDL